MRNTKKINNNEVSLLLQQKRELKVLELKIELMRQLTTASGFFSYYFKKLNLFKTCEDCFIYLNDLYFELFGCYRYSSYKAFCNARA